MFLCYKQLTYIKNGKLLKPEKYLKCTILKAKLCDKNNQKDKKIEKNEAKDASKVKKDGNDSKNKPKRPKKFPEQPAECCMSGCANCVWLDYAEELSRYFKDGGEQAIKEINEKVTDPNIKAYLLHELRMRNKK